MKRGVWFILLFLLLITGVEASTVFNGWSTHENTITTSTGTFTVFGLNTESSDEEQTRVSFRKNGSLGTIVQYGQCRLHEGYNYCYTDRDFERNEIRVDSQGKLQPAIRISIRKHEEPQDFTRSSLQRSLNQTTTYFGETIKVTLSVTNTGTLLSNFTLNEIVPSGLTILETDNLERRNNELNAVFFLRAGNTWTAEYTARVDTYERQTIEGSITYQDRDGTIEEKSASRSSSVSVRSPFDVTSRISRNTIEIRDRLEKTFTVRNTDNEEIILRDIEIHYPESWFNVLSSSSITIQEENFARNRKRVLQPNEQIQFSVSGQERYVGEYLIQYSGTIEAKGDLYPIAGNHTFRVRTPNIRCEVKVFENSFKAGETALVEFGVKSNEERIFYGVQGAIANKEIFIERLQGNEEQKKNYSIALPFSLETYTKDLSFIGQYLSSESQSFPLECSQSITVQAAERMMYMELFTPQEAERNETITVQAIFVNVSTDTQGIMTLGDFEQVISLEKGIPQQQEIEITIPEKFQEEIKNITLEFRTPQGYYETIHKEISILNPLTDQKEIEEEFFNETSHTQNLSAWQRFIERITSWFK